MRASDIVTAAVLVIGDEILSGRTKDKNIGFIADYLTAIGIDLKEVRVVSDDEGAIVEALNALRSTTIPRRSRSSKSAWPKSAASSMKRACAWRAFRTAPRW
jgi:hypothetical protein